MREYNHAIESNDFAHLAVPRTIRKHKPMPILTPPFHAIPLCAGITGTMGGVEINEHAQALRPDGNVFPGLYAVGTPVAGLEGGPRAGYVGGLSKAFILGLLAAEHVAESGTLNDNDAMRPGILRPIVWLALILPALAAQYAAPLRRATPRAPSR